MPHPHGWTDEQVSSRDSCVTDLLREGLPRPKTETQRAQSDRSRAYAICTAAVEHSRKGGNPANPMLFAREVTAALKALWGA